MSHLQSDLRPRAARPFRKTDNLAVGEETQGPVGRVGVDKFLSVELLIDLFEKREADDGVVCDLVFFEALFTGGGVEGVKVIHAAGVKDFIDTEKELVEELQQDT